MLALIGSLTAGTAAETESLTITIGNSGSKFDRKGIEIGAYLVAKGDYGDWTMVDNFSDVKVYAREDGSKWIDQSMTQIQEKIRTQGIRPTVQGASDENGVVSFTNVERGIYFIAMLKGPEWLKMKPMLLSTPDKDGKLAITAGAKVEYNPPTEPPTPQPTPKPTPTQFETPSVEPTETPTQPTGELTPPPTLTPRGITPAPETPTPVPKETPTPAPHKLVIEYIYEDGTTAWPTYLEDGLWPGTPYDVKSPIIAGYTANIKVVQGVMPNHDMYYLVIYVPEGSELIDLDDYKTALGLGNIQMHVGVCFE